MKNNTITAEQHITLLLDVFGGTDGGGGFINFKCKYLKLAADADAGDESAAGIVAVVNKTANLVKYLADCK